MSQKKVGKWIRVEERGQIECFEEMRKAKPSIKPANIYFDFDSCDFYVVSADAELSLSIGEELFDGYIE